MSETVLGGRYRLEARIGSGGMAEVYRGVDTVLDRTVAIKIMHSQFARDANFVEHFRREAQAAARLNHPNIVGVFDSGVDGETQFIVMEFIEGRTLADFMGAGGRFGLNNALEIAEAVCEAIAYAHVAGVIHRDIKPANIMVTRKGIVKVMDFGIARIVAGPETAPQTSAVLGTAAYISPEQAQGKPVDGRTDIYSLGAVLYEMIAGRPPFTGDSPVAIAYKQVNEAPSPPSTVNADVTPSLDAVVMRALAKNPANRYQTADEFREDMERARQNQPVQAPPLLPVGSEATQVISRPAQTGVLPPQEAPPGSGRKVWLGVLIGILAVAMLAAGGYVLANGLLGGNKGTTTTTTHQVPFLIGQTQADATAALQRLNLKWTTKFRATATVKPGKVVDQDPPAGTVLNEGSTVTIVVSKAPTKVTVPDLSLKTVAEANALLTPLGLTLSPTSAASDTVPAGQIVSQQPPPGTQLVKGSTVNVVVSTGPSTVAVPNVTCLPYGSAVAQLHQLGLNPVNGGTTTTNPLCPNPTRVALQDPAAGTTVTAGSTVTLFTGGASPTPDAVPVSFREPDAVTLWFAPETYTPEERDVLARHFTNLDGPVFALTNLPEVVKGALFARYSRTPKSLRRLFLDEFADDVGATGELTRAGEVRAEKLYERVFVEYGDDSVAQLGGVHLACEQASQLLCKALEWGRLAAYLEQSTRYMRYDDKPGGAWRASIPPEFAGGPIEDRFRAFLDEAFEHYGRMYGPLEAFFRERHPKDPNDSDVVYRSTITAKTCDTLRLVLPAATRSNLGIYATGQSYEQLVMRLAAHPLAEMREYGGTILTELRKVIPAFLKRVDVEDRGIAWTRYWRETREQIDDVTARTLAGHEPEPRTEVTLTDWDPDGEVKVVAAALYAAGDLPDDQLLAIARALSPGERAEVFAATVGERRNRRHKPGRAWERTDYRFDVCCDFGAFRDLQRHRPLTVEWQRLTTAHGCETPPAIDESGLRAEWDRAMSASAEMEGLLRDAGMEEAAQYAVAMAYRIRFVMQMDAREAMHLTELRSQPQGHPTYRRVAREMHRLIAEVHPTIGAAFTYVSDEDVELGRLEAERRTEAKRTALDAV